MKSLKNRALKPKILALPYLQPVFYATSGDSFAGNGPVDENGFAYASYAYGQDSTHDLYGAEVNLFGKVTLGGREHTLFFGTDYSHIGQDSRFGHTDFPGAATFNVFHPDYSVPHVSAWNPPADLWGSTRISDSVNDSALYGVTAQLILNPVDRVKWLLGGRYSIDSLITRGRRGAPGAIDGQALVTSNDVDFHNVTFQTGFTYELSQSVNLYASYGQTFEPKTSQVFVAEGAARKLIDPEKGTAYEVGAKADLSKDLFFTLAVFQMERTNISERDLAHPGFFRALGTQRSRGVELGFQGRVSAPLNIFASVGYLDAQFTEGEFSGLTPSGAPRFGASIFGTYEVLRGDLKGLGFGLGGVFKTGLEVFDAGYTRAAGVPVTFDFGSFTEVDARLFYGRGPWGFALSATNLFGEKYYSACANYLGGCTGVNPPRMLRANVRYKFR